MTSILDVGKETLLCCYDPQQIWEDQIKFRIECENEDRIEEAKADHAKRLHPAGYFSDPSAEYIEPELLDFDEGGKEVDRIADWVSQDSWLWQEEWDDFHDYLVETMNERRGDRNGWIVDLGSVSWRNISAEGLICDREDFKDVLRDVLPDTDMHIYAYNVDGKPDSIYLNVSHHDSPCGEGYTFTPVTICGTCDNIVEDDDNDYCNECNEED